MRESALARTIWRGVLWLLVAMGLGAALWGGVARWRVEARNRSVDIAIDFAEARRLAAATGRPIAEVLHRFAQAGVSAILLAEETVGELEQGRRIELASTPTPGVSYVFIHQGNYARVVRHLKARTRFTFASPPGTSAETFQDAGLRIDQPFSLVRPVGLGLDPRTVEVIRAVGLGIVGRVENPEGVRPETVAWICNDLKSSGARAVIFLGDSVLGYKDFLGPDRASPQTPSTASALRATGLMYGSVEFGKQRGDSALTRLVADQVVRVHTVTSAEMATADIPSNIQRFLLAARERNIRLLFVRMFPEERDPVEANARYIEKIVDGLREGGMTPGAAHGFGPLAPSEASRLCLGIGLGAATALLIDAVFGIFVGGSALLVAATLLLAGAVAALPTLVVGLGAKGSALLAAFVFPTLGMVLADLRAPSRSHAWFVALGRLLLASLITLVGASYLVGLLADRAFLVRADAFAGIKVAQLVPLFLVAFLYGFDLRSPTWKEFLSRWRLARERLRALVYQPLYLWQVGAGVMALLVVVLLVERSGNDPGIGVSALELKLRAFLDRLLYARPRNKELIGHAVMFLGLFLAQRGRRAWALPLILVGAIGQVSLFNTFCHLHTPLLVSLWRAGLGLGLGVVVGGIVSLVMNPTETRPRATATPVPDVVPVLVDGNRTIEMSALPEEGTPP